MPQSRFKPGQWVPATEKELNEVVAAAKDNCKLHGDDCFMNQPLKPSNPKDASATNRLDLSLFPATARAYGALAMVEGDQKYGGYNYRAAGVNASVYYAACNRHLDKWYNGEVNDPVTGVPHLANAIACLAVLIDGIEKGNWTDDRPPKVDLTRLLNEFEGRVAKVKEVFPRRTERYTEVKHELSNHLISKYGSNQLGAGASAGGMAVDDCVYGDSAGEYWTRVGGV